MGIRNGIYAKYKEREYGISTTNIDGSRMIDACRLISGDKIDMEQNGFSLYILPEYITIKGKQYKFEDGGKPTGSYYKTVTPSEVDEVYRINTLAEYKNITMAVIGENETQYLLYIGDEVGNGLGFENIGRSEYQKWINKEDVANVHEVKRPSPHFFGS